MKITLVQEPVYTTFNFSQASTRDMFHATSVIRSACMAKPQGYQFMPKFKSGMWDGFIHLCKGNKFPTGLVHLVTDRLVEAGYEVAFALDHKAPEIDWDALTDYMFTPKMILRDYQLDAAKILMIHERGVAKMATNSGKTLVIAAIARMVQAPVLILVTRKELLYQTENVLDVHLGEPIGLVGDGHMDFERVTVGMIQTLHRRLTDHPDTRIYADLLGCVIFDECHHVPSRTAQDVMNAIPAPLRFGFSGTPLSYDVLTDLTLMGATGPVRIEVTNEDLVASGISARPTVYMYKIEDVDCQDAKYQEAYKDCIVDNPWRNEVIAEQVIRRPNRSALILVERIQHGRTLQDLIPSSQFVNGSDAIEVRQQALDQLRAGDGAIVIATPIFDEGVDVPAVDLLVIAGGGKGHKKLLQRLGRGMRAKGGDNTLTVIDFADCTNKYLVNHSRARWAIYKAEGFDVEIME